MPIRGGCGAGGPHAQDVRVARGALQGGRAAQDALHLPGAHAPGRERDQLRLLAAQHGRMALALRGQGRRNYQRNSVEWGMGNREARTVLQILGDPQ